METESFGGAFELPNGNISTRLHTSQLSFSAWQKLWKSRPSMATAIKLWAGNLLILLAPVGYRPSVNLCILDFLAEVWQMPGHERLTWKGR